MVSRDHKTTWLSFRFLELEHCPERRRNTGGSRKSAAQGPRGYRRPQTCDDEIASVLRSADAGQSSTDVMWWTLHERVSRCRPLPLCPDAREPSPLSSRTICHRGYSTESHRSIHTYISFRRSRCAGNRELLLAGAGH